MTLQTPPQSELTSYALPLTDSGLDSRMHAPYADTRRKRNWFVIILSVVLVGPFVLMIGIVFLLALIATIGGTTQDQASAKSSLNVAPVAAADRDGSHSNGNVILRNDSLDGDA